MSINNSKNQGEYRKAINDLESNYLPKTGGTMTGSITTTAVVPIMSSTDSSSIEFHAGGSSYKNGAYLYMTGQNHSDAGSFTLAASGNETICRLTGKKDGTLTWNGYSVITATTKDTIINKNTISDYKVPTHVLKATLTSTASDGTSGTTTNEILSVGRQDGNGLNTILGAKGGTMIVAGEGAASIRSDLSVVGAGENIVLAADSNIIMKTNCGTDANYSGGTSLTFNKNSRIVTSTYSSNYNWYRIWSDNWIEQGGTFGANTGNWVSTSITFLKPFKNNYYHLHLQGNWSNPESSSCEITARTTSGATVTHANNQYSIYPSIWYACGFI